MATPARRSTAHATTHNQLSALQAALHGGLPPAMLRNWITHTDSDSDSDNEHIITARSIPISARAHSRSRSIPTPAPTPPPLENHRSPGSVSSTDSEGSGTSSRVREPVCSVLDAPRTVVLRERSGASGSSGYPTPARSFRVREGTNGRIMNVTPRDDALACVSCRSGVGLWSVYTSRHARARVLRRHGSPYFVVLGATHWKRHLERAAQGYLHAEPHLKRAPALAIEVVGDKLGKVFRILGRDANATVSLATARRATKLEEKAYGAGVRVQKLASWTIQMEKNVDCAMITAVVYVIEEWCTKPPTDSFGHR